MPDWRQVVRAQLPDCEMAAADREDVVHEMAAHLEETYDAAVASGLNEQAAGEVALHEVDDWRALARGVIRAKSMDGPMNYRTRSLWLPALITMLGASLSLAATQMLGVQPRLVWIGTLGTTLYWQWLATLPFLGALGAFLSRRSRGAIPARLVAGLSPALIMLTVMCLILPWGLMIDGLSFFRLVAFGLGLVNWVAIPGVALALGAVPLLRKPD